MDNYEQEVRIALANEFANRARQVYSDNGEVAIIKKDIEDSVTGALDGLVQAEEVTALEAHKIGAELTSSLAAEYTPDNVAQQAADSWMNDKSDCEKKYGAIFQMIEAKVGQNLEGMKTCYDGLLNIVERRDRIVNTLVEKAQKDDISKATNVQTIRAAIRKEFPTAKEYVKGATDLISAASQLAYSIGNLMGEDSVIGKLMPTITDKITQIYVDTIIKADVDVLYKK